MACMFMPKFALRGLIVAGIALSAYFLKIQHLEAQQWATLPLEFSQGLPSARVTVNGQEIPLIVDLGASRPRSAIMLSLELIEALSVGYTSDADSFRDIYGQQVDLDGIAVDLINAGGPIVEDLHGGLFTGLWGGSDVDSGFIETEASTNGILGLRFFTKFQGVLFDYSNSQMVLTVNGQLPAEYDIRNWQRIPFGLNGGVRTYLEIQRQEFGFVWDTGASHSPVKQAVLNAASSLESVDLYGISGFCINSVKSANTEIGPMGVNLLDESADLPFDGLIGRPFFEEHIVYIDFESYVIYVQRIETGPC